MILHLVSYYYKIVSYSALLNSYIPMSVGSGQYVVPWHALAEQIGIDSDMFYYGFTDGEDYQSIGIVNLVFSADTTEIGTIIPIIDDVIDESTEQFFTRLNLVMIRPNIIVSPASATIQILDDDGTYVITHYI